jgi:hypothetical protein
MKASGIFSNYLIGAGAGVGATIPVALEDLQHEEESGSSGRGARFAVRARARDRLGRRRPRSRSTRGHVDRGDQFRRCRGRPACQALRHLGAGAADADSPVARRQLLETVLFESGRPILISPPEAPQSLGKRVMVAWNGSTETTRAIHFAMAFLAKAEWVLVWRSRAAWWRARAPKTCAAC